MSSLTLTSLELFQLDAAGISEETLKELPPAYIRNIYKDQLIADPADNFASLYNSLLLPVSRDYDTKEERFLWMENLAEVVAAKKWAHAATLVMTKYLVHPHDENHAIYAKYRERTPRELIPTHQKLALLFEETMAALVLPAYELTEESFPYYETLTQPYIEMLKYGKKMLHVYPEDNS